MSGLEDIVSAPDVGNDDYDIRRIRNLLNMYCKNRFSNIRLKGKGSQGIVFLVYDEYRKMDIAVKMPIDPNDAGGLSAKFLESMAIKSNYVVAAYDAPQIGNVHVLFMEAMYADLESVLSNRQGGCLDKKTALNVVIKICTGLEAIHLRGYVHRDIQPRNILFGKKEVALPDGTKEVVPDLDQPKISDLGIIKRENVFTTFAKGNVQYSAPELAISNTELRQGGEKSYVGYVESDIYSVGALLYRMLSGSVPFEEKYTGSELEKIKMSEKYINNLKSKHICEDVMEIIKKCLQPDYRKRYHTAAELKKDLIDAYAGKKVQPFEKKVDLNEVRERIKYIENYAKAKINYGITSPEDIAHLKSQRKGLDDYLVSQGIKKHNEIKPLVEALDKLIEEERQNDLEIIRSFANLKETDVEEVIRKHLKSDSKETIRDKAEKYLRLVKPEYWALPPYEEEWKKWKKQFE